MPPLGVRWGAGPPAAKVTPFLNLHPNNHIYWYRTRHSRLPSSENNQAVPRVVLVPGCPFPKEKETLGLPIQGSAPESPRPMPGLSVFRELVSVS